MCLTQVSDDERLTIEQNLVLLLRRFMEVPHRVICPLSHAGLRLLHQLDPGLYAGLFDYHGWPSFDQSSTVGKAACQGAWRLASVVSLRKHSEDHGQRTPAPWPPQFQSGPDQDEDMGWYDPDDEAARNARAHQLFCSLFVDAAA